MFIMLNWCCFDKQDLLIYVSVVFEYPSVFMLCFNSTVLCIQFLYYMCHWCSFFHQIYIFFHFYVSLVLICLFMFLIIVLFNMVICVSIIVYYVSLVLWCPSRFCILCFTGMYLSITILYFIFHWYVFIHPYFVFYVSLVCICPLRFCF